MQTTRIVLKFLILFALWITTWICLPVKLSGQVIFDEHFESYPLGVFTTTDARNGGWDPRIGFTEQRMNIINGSSQGSSTQMISMIERVGEWGYWNGASKFRRWFNGADEVFYGYKVKFDANFDWKKGGKLLSLSGGSPPGAGVDVDGSKGASVGFMWRPEVLGQSTAPTDKGILHAYTYHEGKTVTWGQEDVLEDGNGGHYLVEKNRWYKLVFRIKMNDQDIPNGIVQIWMDGVLRVDRRDFLFRTRTGTWNWDLFDFLYFFGGDGPGWSPDQDSEVYVDSLIMALDIGSLGPLMNGNTTPPPGGGGGGGGGGSSNIPPTADIATNVTSGSVPLVVNFDGSGSTDPDNNISTYEWNFGDGNTATGQTVSHTYTSAGTFQATLKVTDSAGDFDVVSVTITPGAACGPIPSEWSTADIGAVAISGNACYDSTAQKFNLDASGADVWASDDQFRFVYQSMTGDGEIIARVTSLSNTHDYAKAGVMMRESLTNDSRHAMMVVNQSRHAFQYRDAIGGVTNPTTGSWLNSYVTFPIWVKITRINGVFTGYVSYNGLIWEEIASYYIPMGQTVYVGLMHTSHDNTKLGKSSFDSVSVGGANSSSSCGDIDSTWAQTDIGTVGIAGGSCFNDTTERYSLIASGTDIWGNTDQLHFMHKSMQGDGEITVRVVNIGNTHPYAKGGLMMRETTDAGSKQVSVLMNQTQKAMHMRNTTGGLTVLSDSGWTSAVPSNQIYMRLVRVGNVFATFTSPQGRSWRYIHSEEIPMAQNIEVGVAATSHDNLAVNISAFEELTLEIVGSPSQNSNGSGGVDDFSGSLVGQGVRLRWTAPDVYVSGFFTVERSLDGILYENLGNVIGPGNAGTADDYTFVDENPAIGRTIYRLRQNNYNGTYEYAGSVEVDNNPLFHGTINVYPNPTLSHSITVDMIGMELDQVREVALMDVAGRKLYSIKPSSNSQLISFPSSIPTGMYLLQVSYGDAVIGKRIVLK